MLFEGKIKVERENKKGVLKPVLEHYIIDGVELFSEAEYKLMQLANGECEVVAITKSKVREIVNLKEDDKPFFRAVIVDIFVCDDGTEKETKYPVLVCAEDVNEANKLIDEYMKAGLNDMKLQGITETKILDVL